MAMRYVWMINYNRCDQLKKKKYKNNSFFQSL